MKNLLVTAPATVSNVGPGFDLMGFALEEPVDILEIRRNKLDKLRIINESGIPLPEDPEKNVASVAALALIRAKDLNPGFDLVFKQKIHPGSGIGSSAASCAAAVAGLNAFLDSPATPTELIDYALQGEFIASGSLHADNIAPAVLGGFVLIRSYDPIDIVRINYPEDLLCVIVHPYLEIKTAESRKLIPQEIALKTALSQAGNLATLVNGLSQGDYEMIGRALEDKIAEPLRKQAIPGYDKLRIKLLGAGVTGMNISGSGPSLFALCRERQIAEQAAVLMEDSFKSFSISARTYISPVSNKGTKIIA